MTESKDFGNQVISNAEGERIVARGLAARAASPAAPCHPDCDYCHRANADGTPIAPTGWAPSPAAPEALRELEAENERLAARIAELNADDARLRDAFAVVRRGGMPPSEVQIIDAYKAGLLMYRPPAAPAAPEALTFGDLSDAEVADAVLTERLDWEAEQAAPAAPEALREAIEMYVAAHENAALTPSEELWLASFRAALAAATPAAAPDIPADWDGNPDHGPRPCDFGWGHHGSCWYESGTEDD